MSRLGAAVHVITSDGPAGRLGFTASAVCSVSDSPATLLVCMNRNSEQNDPLRRNGVFCVNCLAGEQQDLSEMFAGYGGIAMRDRFDRQAWRTLTTGSPVLDGTLVSFDCRIASTFEVATHTLLIGEVMSVRAGNYSNAALIYFQRQYHTLRA
ncbi:flavin reductase [Acidovorax sp. MR-S7]|uniref:flavin reductase n=1 Tax=Acidovorax sp. MR-S7 TaxID=1268622 RepID=UPI001F3BDD62|nr:flavin reductase [Acidovorax sp. MR-S7]